MSEVTDRIERKIVLKAPLARVWRAISNAGEFGDWFGVALKGQHFVAGQRARGSITYPGYEHIIFDVDVVEVVPEQLLSFRWHPYPADPNYDYSQEATTLVEFKLSEIDGGTLVKVVESGFDQVPVARRLEAFRMNSGGWDGQMKNIEQYVSAKVSA